MEYKYKKQKDSPINICILFLNMVYYERNNFLYVANEKNSCHVPCICYLVRMSLVFEHNGDYEWSLIECFW